MSNQNENVTSSKTNMLSEKKKREIVETLQQKGVNAPCPMCRHNAWVIADGYFNRPIQMDFRGMSIGGPSIPSISIICSNCGFISEHALGALGLLPSGEESK